jgi:carotenoid cleavage dioxygenase-like enzyme
LRAGATSGEKGEVSELSPYLQGPYAPIAEEREAELEVVAGEIPRDLSGLYVRNGPNPRFAPPGRYHWFDGDGMLHAARIRDGRVTYRNRWVDTRGLADERAAGEALYAGVMEPVRRMAPTGPYKDTANTDVVWFDGGLLALWYVSGEPYRVGADDLRTVGPHPFAAQARAAGGTGLVSAHPKVDPRTGELLYFSYGFAPPYMHYGVVGPDGRLAHHVQVDLPGARLPHDMAFTEDYAILMDLPVFYDPEALAAGRWVTRFYRELPARFGILPRRGAEVRWFEAEPCYIYHVVNAWQEGPEVVMVACRVDDPIPAPDPSQGKWARMLANLRVQAYLHRWRFNLETGAVKEERLDDLNAEFPTAHLGLQGVKSRFGYCATLAHDPTLFFDGFVKYDLADGAATRYDLPAGARGSEAPFAPAEGATAEDDGYLVSFVHPPGADASELWIMDARALERGPIARARVPGRVPAGFHATWVTEAELARG